MDVLAPTQISVKNRRLENLVGVFSPVIDRFHFSNKRRHGCGEPVSIKLDSIRSVRFGPVLGGCICLTQSFRCNHDRQLLNHTHWHDSIKEGEQFDWESRYSRLGTVFILDLRNVRSVFAVTVATRLLLTPFG